MRSPPATASVVDLLRAIVRIPSVSGEEVACRDHLVAWLDARGVDVRAVGRNAVAVIEGPEAGDASRGLLLCSHIDVVPVGPGWTRAPWDGALEDGRVWGRGANDAKASVAAMAWTAAHVESASLGAGRLVLALVCDEETGGEGLEVLGEELGPFTASVVGEPTGLDVCRGQRGLLRTALVAEGKSAHASRPWEGENAIRKVARDLVALEGLDLGAEDPLLGPTTLEPTVISGGTRPNVLPWRCTVEFDARTTPACDNARLLERLQAVVKARVVVRSNRFQPVVTPEDAAIVRVALAASPTGRIGALGGVSDLFHVRHVPGVILGPGTSEASHAPDEWVAVSQVEAAVTTYARIVGDYLGGSIREI
ncbi:MAG: M20 family metallopeptidase [Planctomycetota bacterium]